MATPNSAYWQKRFIQLEKALISKDQAYIAALDEAYRKASANIEAEISKWYMRFAENNEISLLDAKRILNTRELAEFRWTVEDYIKHGSANVSQQWTKQLENASAKAHITRLEALQINLQQQVEVLYGNRIDSMEKHLRSIYSSQYYGTGFEIQKGFGVGWSVAGVDTNRVDRLLSQPWTADGKTFSNRVWTHQAELLQKLRVDLTQSIMRGDSPQSLITSISKDLGVARHRASTLVMTESAYVASAGQKDMFDELDVKEYIIVATLDESTSELCRELDGKLCLMKDYEVGVTAPPFHPRCRTVTAPYFEDNFISERAARGADGKTYMVNGDMTYKEWYEKHVLPANPWQSIIGLETSEGNTIRVIKPHLLDQSAKREVDLEAVKEALIDPLHVSEPKQNERNELSVKYIGKQATVAFNPETNTVVTTWRTGKRTAAKFEKKEGGRK